jgi:hypothetical protein
MTSSGMDLAIFQIVAECLNQLLYRVLHLAQWELQISRRKFVSSNED